MRALFALMGCSLVLSSLQAQGPPGAATASSKVQVGKPAPDFEVTGIDGKPIKLSGLTAKGKNVVVLFDRAHW